MLKQFLICFLGINIAYCQPFSIWGSDSNPTEAPNTMFRRSLGNIFSAISNPSQITNAIPFLNVRIDERRAPIQTTNNQQSYKFGQQSVPVYTKTVMSENVPAIRNEPLMIEKHSPKSELNIEQNPTVVKTVPELQENNYDADPDESIPVPVYQQFSEDNSILVLEDVLQSTENFGDYSTYTTEDYESTTLDVDVFNRMGAPPPAVVASLLG